MKAMELHQIDSKIAFFFGMTGGFIKYMSGVTLEAGFAWRLMEAGITAMVCGFLGLAGKYMFDWIKKKYFNKKR